VVVVSAAAVLADVGFRGAEAVLVVAGVPAVGSERH